MTTEYQLSYTASDINKRLGMVDNMVKSVNGVIPDESGNVAIEVGSSDSSQNLNDFVALATGTKIAENTDLDTILTFGNYKCTSAARAKTLLNCPTGSVFIMRVGSPAPGVPNYFYQEIITLRGVRYYRYSYDNEDKLKWTSWDKSFDTNEVIPARYGGMGANISSDLGETLHLKACQKFVDKMNEFAEDIGMNKTTFKTPSGLQRNMINSSKGGSSTDYNNKTTACDLLRALVAVKHTPTVLRAMGAAECDYFLNSVADHSTSNIAGNDVWNAWAYKHGYTILASKGGSLKGSYGEIGSSGIRNNASLIKDSEGNVFAVVVLGLRYPDEWEQNVIYSKDDQVLDKKNVTYISLKDNNKNHAVTDAAYWKVGISGGNTWLASTTYKKGDKVIVDNVTYISLQGDNKNHAVTDKDYWKVLTYEGEIRNTLIHDLIGMAKGGAETAVITEAKNRTNPVCMAVAKLTTSGSFDDDIATLESCIHHQGDEIRVAASTTKIVTALVANRYMGNYQCTVNYDDLVGGSGLEFEVGDEISTIDAMNLMLAISDNAMATMLARVCGIQMYVELVEVSSSGVYSVNGKTGKVTLTASDVGARPVTWMPTANEVGALPSNYVPPDQTPDQVGADPAGTADHTVDVHDKSTTSHNDLRQELKALSSSKLDATDLPNAINAALAQAKASGEFNYVLTELDKAEIVDAVLMQIDSIYKSVWEAEY